MNLIPNQDLKKSSWYKAYGMRMCGSACRPVWNMYKTYSEHLILKQGGKDVAGMQNIRRLFLES